MLLYTLDELFYIYDQVKRHRGIDEKWVVAYEILGLTTLHCTEHRGGVEKQGMPELPGACHWCTLLVTIYKHIYRGWDDVAHCPPYTLALWDCQQRTRAPTERCSSPVEAVLTGSRAALLGLVEIFMGPHWGHGAINQG